MSSDPHAPTPAGPDPDEPTEVRPPADPFAPPLAGDPAPDYEATVEGAEKAPEPAEVPADAGAGADVVGAPVVREPEAAAPEGDWLKPDAQEEAVATPEPDPVIATPSSFTPLGTPEPTLEERWAAIQEKPEAMVGLAFLGGAVGSFLLKRLGRK